MWGENTRQQIQANLTFALELVAGLCVEALQEDAHVLVELVPVAVDDVEHSVVLDLTLLQLVNSAAQLLVGPVVALQALETTQRDGPMGQTWCVVVGSVQDQLGTQHLIT